MNLEAPLRRGFVIQKQFTRSVRTNLIRTDLPSER